MRKLWGLALLLWLLIFCAAPLHAQGTALSLADYLARREQALVQLDADARGEANSAAAADALAAARTTLAEVRRVQMPSGDVITLWPLLADLGDEPDRSVEDVAAARAQLTLVISQIEASAGDNLAARLAVLDEVLAPRPECSAAVVATALAKRCGLAQRAPARTRRPRR